MAMLFFCNITTWGPLTEGVMVGWRRRYDVMSFAETHLSAEAFKRIESKMSSWGRRAYPAHARPTGRSKGGTHGGVLVAPKTGLQLAPMPKGEEQAWRIKGDDWSLIVIRATNVSFIKVAAYFTDSIGATGVDVKKMQQLAKAVMSYDLPFVICADWNMEPE